MSKVPAVTGSRVVGLSRALAGRSPCGEGRRRPRRRARQSPGRSRARGRASPSEHHSALARSTCASARRAAASHGSSSGHPSASNPGAVAHGADDRSAPAGRAPLRARQGPPSWFRTTSTVCRLQERERVAARIRPWGSPRFTWGQRSDEPMFPDDPRDATTLRRVPSPIAVPRHRGPCSFSGFASRDGMGSGPRIAPLPSTHHHRARG
jgi:hypothetical protein